MKPVLDETILMRLEELSAMPPFNQVMLGVGEPNAEQSRENELFLITITSVGSRVIVGGTNKGGRRRERRDRERERDSETIKVHVYVH